VRLRASPDGELIGEKERADGVADNFGGRIRSGVPVGVEIDGSNGEAVRLGVGEIGAWCGGVGGRSTAVLELVRFRRSLRR